MDDLYLPPIQEPDLTANLTAREKSLRDKFVEEYLIDYDEFQAAVRVGYGPSYAKDYAVRFMQEPYVLQQIRLLETEPNNDSPEGMKKRILVGLIREANYRGSGCSQAARVAALAKLASIHGMDAPFRSKNEFTGPDGQPLNGGVFVVPGLMTPEEWEKQAEAQQQALVAAPTVESLAPVDG